MAHKALRKQLVEALVFWKLDLNDVVLYPLSQFCLFDYSKLQRVQRCAASFKKRYARIPDVM
ncbi:unnamed protein product, partial [Porites lobata]